MIVEVEYDKKTMEIIDEMKVSLKIYEEYLSNKLKKELSVEENRDQWGFTSLILQSFLHDHYRNVILNEIKKVTKLAHPVKIKLIKEKDDN